jgi:sugar (pentulose or hexulose) kinase
VLEGVAFGIRARLDTLARTGPAATELRVSGGGGQLPGWNTIKADVLGIPVRRVPGDATATGVAMLAGLGIGAYANPAEAIAAACHVEPAVDPDPAVHATYAGLYEHYREVVASSVVRVQATGAVS